jgi:hypothetical protein
MESYPYTIQSFSTNFVSRYSNFKPDWFVQAIRPISYDLLKTPLGYSHNLYIQGIANTKIPFDSKYTINSIVVDNSFTSLSQPLLPKSF